MKPENVNKAALRVLTISKIDMLRASINNVLQHGKVPQWVIDGSYSQTVKYKEALEKDSGVYHVMYPPGKRNSLKELILISEKLTTINNKLTGV